MLKNDVLAALRPAWSALAKLQVYRMLEVLSCVLVILFKLDMTLYCVMPVEHQQVVLLLVEIVLRPALLVFSIVEADTLLVEMEPIHFRELGKHFTVGAVQIFLRSKVDNLVPKVTVISLKLVTRDMLVPLSCEGSDDGSQCFSILLPGRL